MLSRGKLVGALTSVTAALVVGLPAVSASADTAPSPTVDPLVCQLLTPAPGVGWVLGGASLSNVLAQAGASVNCPASAPASQPWLPFGGSQPSLFGG